MASVNNFYFIGKVVFTLQKHYIQNK